MSKISIPIDGITNKVSEPISRCKTALNNAQKNTSFSIPSGFNYTNFCNELDTTISTYMNEINDISNKIKETEKKYMNLSDNISSSVNSTPATIIESHDRLILKN